MGDSLSSDHLRKAVRHFLQRDFRADVVELNTSLRKDRKSDAGFVEAPPSVLTGDPFALEPGNCIGVFGLNPAWHAGAHIEANATEAEIRDGRFEEHERRRAAYFDAGSSEYNRYFTRLGNRIIAAKLVEAADARAVFKRYAFKFDLLPWWSTDTSRISSSKLTSSVKPIAVWQTVVWAALEVLKPRLLLVNGSSWAGLTEEMFDTDLREFRYDGSRRAFHGMAGPGRTPILVHGQVGSIKGPQSDSLYVNLIQEWERIRTG